VPGCFHHLYAAAFSFQHGYDGARYVLSGASGGRIRYQEYSTH
jgi:hypothetical protein